MDEFDRYRAEMNEKLTGGGHLGIKRFFALDTHRLMKMALSTNEQRNCWDLLHQPFSVVTIASPITSNNVRILVSHDRSFSTPSM